ncbi:MAG: hypothetical protein QW379_04120 [Thermoplasmata archaeon]
MITMDTVLLKDVLIAWMTVFSLTLLVISILSYARTRNPRIALVSLAFFLFFAKGVALSIGLYWPSILSVTTDLPSLLFDVLILLILFVATLRD